MLFLFRQYIKRKSKSKMKWSFLNMLGDVDQMSEEAANSDHVR